jgi:hypothetical protein
LSSQSPWKPSRVPYAHQFTTGADQLLNFSIRMPSNKLGNFYFPMKSSSSRKLAPDQLYPRGGVVSPMLQCRKIKQKAERANQASKQPAEARNFYKTCEKLCHKERKRASSQHHCPSTTAPREFFFYFQREREVLFLK